VATGNRTSTTAPVGAPRRPPAQAERRIIDSIIELKVRCRFEEEIGEACGLAGREVTCLGVISPGERVSAGVLANRMGLSPSRASRIITSLREKGYIAEGFDENDRRSVSISLTAAGAGISRDIERKKGECERKLLGGFSRPQLSAIQKGLATLSLAFQGGNDEPVRRS
jgi:DNA-binding MarR family transcriptional regulator